MAETSVASRRAPRLGFRTQLAMLIAVTISLSGAAALSALYVVVANQLNVHVQATPPQGPQGETTPTPTPQTPSSPAPVGPTVPAGPTGPHPTPSGPGHTSGSDDQPDPSGAGGGEGDSVVINGNRIDVLSTATSDILRRTLLWLGGLVLLLTLVSTAVGWWLSGRLLRRVTEITRTARTVADGDLGARLALPGPKDEITELGDTFDDMLERLDTAMTAQRRFVSNASHELRTPLASGRLALEAPLDQGLLEGPGQVAAERALGSMKRASTILSSLLTLATTTGSRGEVDESVDLSLTAEDAIEDETELVRARGQHLDQRLEPAMTQGDPALIALAIRNLVRNAVVHSPEGATITIVSRTTDGEARFETSNPGATYGADTLNELLEPFHRGPDSRLGGAEGSGLGLSIVEAVAQRFAGRVQLQPREGGGLHVVLAFPATPTHGPIDS